MIYRISELFILIITIWFAFTPLIIIGIVYDKIDINFNNDYLEEYSSCQAELERLTPNCPDCVCKTSSGFYQMIAGFLWGLILMYFIRSGAFKEILKKKPHNKRSKK